MSETALPTGQWNELHELLLRERAALRKTIGTLDEAVRQLGESQVAEGTAGSGGDLAGDLAEQELNLTLETAELERLSEVEAALERLALSVYGRCERCGETIPPDRLLARPWARRCVRCAQLERVS